MTFVNPLVLDGETVKLRLMADRLQTGSHVHIDWLRFTVPLQIQPEAPDVDILFPKSTTFSWSESKVVSVGYERDKMLIADALYHFTKKEQEASLFGAAQYAGEIAAKLAHVLGGDFSVSPEIKKGHDFYAHRISILREDHECAWVGFGVTGKHGASKERQAKTVHVNVYGHACTFADFGWRERMATLMENYKAKVTRVDLALDFFEGLPRGIDGVLQDYRAGLCDVRGNTPKLHQQGDFVANFGRSVYLGSREAGKITNIYEKGHQLYGKESPSNWERIELRYGNKARFLPVDILRRPADYFSGASDWHAAKLREAEISFVPQSIPVNQRLPIESVSAEVYRSMRWLRDVAVKNVRTALHYLDDKQLFDLLSPAGVPSSSAEPPRPTRLQKFKPSELAAAFSKQIKHFSTPQFISPTASSAFC